jgi:hypothetical protein
VICYKIAGGDTDTAISEPREAKDASIQRKDGEFDDAHTPGVDENVRKCDLFILARR